jgi:uncharacterized protein YaaQ
MKLIVAIVQDYDCDRLLRAVTDAGFGSTRIASTGGFLRTGITTVLMGVAAERVAECLALINNVCGARVERAPVELTTYLAESYPQGLAEVMTGGAVTFVVPVARFERFDRHEDG